MLQSMLASRFQLTAHTEKKELSCYELVVARDGLKLRALVADDTGPRLYPGAGGIRASAISIQRLAELLTLRTDRPVLDKTGVSGVFDIDLKWAADPATEPGPSLFTAGPEQLGLRLQAGRSPIETLVIDRIAKPSEN
jgi:uncharacterized protein (TIGR03435 family)